MFPRGERPMLRFCCEPRALLLAFATRCHAEPCDSFLRSECPILCAVCKGWVCCFFYVLVTIGTTGPRKSSVVILRAGCPILCAVCKGWVCFGHAHFITESGTALLNPRHPPTRARARYNLEGSLSLFLSKIRPIVSARLDKI